MSLDSAPTTTVEGADSMGRTARGWQRWALLGIALAVALYLPWGIYPPVAIDILCWALAAVALDLLLGFGGLLSFGHAAFWGGSAYVTGIVALRSGLPFPVAVLAGVLAAMILAVPIGYLSVRRQGIYFAMVTLAFAQMLYFVANQARDLTGGENGLQGVPRTFFGIEAIETDAFYFYYAVLPFVILGMWCAWRVVHSPFGRVLVATRDNPARARALGYDVEKYRVLVFVISAGLAGLAGGLFAVSHGFVSLQEANWTTSGKIVLLAVLGGIGTLWGGVIGSIIIVTLEDYLATVQFDSFADYTGIGTITGAVFVIVILTLRKGIWGSTKEILDSVSRRRDARERAKPASSGSTEAAGSTGSTASTSE